MFKFLTSFFLFCGLMCAGNACVSTNAVTTNWNTASTWINCGATSSIGRDSTVSDSGYTGSGTASWSHTVGSNAHTLLYVVISSANGTDGVSAVTVDSTSMGSPVVKYHGSTWLYIYQMYAPSSGSHTIAVTSSTQFEAYGISYYGVAQSGQPDASGTTTGTTSTPSVSLTPVAANPWVLGVFYDPNGGLFAGTGNTKLINLFAGFGGLGGILSTEALVPSSGSYTLSASSNSGVVDRVAISIAPFSSTANVVPQTTDTVQIATPVTLNTSPTVVSVLVEGTSANLITDGSAHTVTTTNGVLIEQGCTTTTSPCVSPYAVDSSTGSAGNEITWVRTGMTTGQYLLENDYISPFTCPPICSVNVNLSHSIFQAGSGGVYAGNNGGSLTVNNSEIVNGERGFYLANVGSVTLNNVSSTGMGNTDAFVQFASDVPTSCSISNLTQINATSNQEVLIGAADLSACSFTGNAIRTDPAGVYNPRFIVPNGTTPTHAQTYSYNLAKNYATTISGGAVVYGLGGCQGTSTYHCIWQNNILDGYQNRPGNYTDLLGNVCIFLPTGGLQGCMFAYNQQFVTSTNEVYVSNSPSNGNVMFYIIGAASPTGGAVLTNDTFIGTLSTTSADASESGPTWGEVNAMSVGNSLSNTILYGQNYGAGENMSSGNPNTFLTTGTDGVGVWNNDYFGQQSGGWQPGGQIGNNVDDGTHHHPNALYGDTTYNPGFYTQYRSWAQCDAILGGTGSEANLFTQLFNRWNGSNTVNYTAQSIYNCMFAGYAPTNISLAGKGAVKPHLMFTGVQ